MIYCKNCAHLDESWDGTEPRCIAPNVGKRNWYSASCDPREQNANNDCLFHAKKETENL